MMAPEMNTSRKRARTAEDDSADAEDASVAAKGGHSLRKRQRKNYNTILVDDEDDFRKETKAPAPSTRPKRKTAAAAATTFADLESDNNSSAIPQAKKQRNAAKSQEPAVSQPARRKAQPRKTVNGTKISAAKEKQNDNDVKDTIEVGVAFAESDDSEEPSASQASQSEPSSAGTNGNAVPKKTTTASVVPGTGIIKFSDVPSFPSFASLHEASPAKEAKPVEVPAAVFPVAQPQGDEGKEISEPAVQQSQTPAQQKTEHEVTPSTVEQVVNELVDAVVENSTTDGKEEAVAVAPSSPVHDAPIPESAPAPVARMNALRATSVGSTTPALRAASAAPTTSMGNRVTKGPKRSLHAEAQAKGLNTWQYIGDIVAKEMTSKRPNSDRPKFNASIHSLVRRNTSDKDDPLSLLKATKRTPAAKFGAHMNFLDNENGTPSKPKGKGKYANLTPYLDGTVMYPEIEEAEESEHGSRVADDEVPDLTLDIVDASIAPTSTANTPAIGSPEVTPLPDPDTFEDAIAEAAAAPVSGKEQYQFRKIRDTKEFLAALKDAKSLPTEDLFDLLATANDALVAYQEEYQQMTMITEAEDNAARRRAQDATYVKATEAAIKKGNLNKDVVNPDFLLKGSRARETTHLEMDDMADHATASYLRQQDKVMAQAYGFEYDSRKEKIGKQDPVEQREGLGSIRGLRTRPKPTQKAADAEADETLGTRRTRRLKSVDVESLAPSRAGSPALLPPPELEVGRRGRGIRLSKKADDEHSVGELVTRAPSPKKAGRRARASAKSKLSTSIAPMGADVSLFSTEGAEIVDEQPKKSRKRGRGAVEDEPAAPNPGPKRPKITIKNNGNGNGHMNAPPLDSNLSPTTDVSRPSTADSTRTADTVVSDYSFRPKRQKTFKTKASAPAQEQPLLPKPSKPRSGGGVAGKFNTMPADRGGPTSLPPPPHHTHHMPQQQQPPFADFSPAHHPGHGQVIAWSQMIPVEHNTHSMLPTPGHFPPMPPTMMPSQPPLAPAPPVGPTVSRSNQQSMFKIPNYHHGAPPMLSTTSMSGPATMGAPSLLPRSEDVSRSQTPVPVQGPPVRPGGVGNLAPGEAENFGEETEQKEYRQMTKSEKMSHSMRTRWANGSMASAVAKRKATLAAKKATQAQATTGSPAGGGSTDGTPAPPSLAPSEG